MQSPMRFDGGWPQLAASPEMGQNTEAVQRGRGLDLAAPTEAKKVGAIL